MCESIPAASIPSPERKPRGKKIFLKCPASGQFPLANVPAPLPTIIVVKCPTVPQSIRPVHENLFCCPFLNKYYSFSLIELHKTGHEKKHYGQTKTKQVVWLLLFMGLLWSINGHVIPKWRCFALCRIELDWIVIYCVVLCCTVLYYVVLCCIVLCCVVLCCVVLCCVVLYCIVLCCVVFHCIVLHCIVLCCIVLHCIVLCIVLCCVVLYCIVLYFVVLYCIVLYCIVLYCIVLYKTQQKLPIKACHPVCYITNVWLVLEDITSWTTSCWFKPVYPILVVVDIVVSVQSVDVSAATGRPALRVETVPPILSFAFCPRNPHYTLGYYETQYKSLHRSILRQLTSVRPTISVFTLRIT